MIKDDLRSFLLNRYEDLEEITIHDAYKQLKTRYRRDIPELLKYNVFAIISDGVNIKAVTLFSL